VTILTLPDRYVAASYIRARIAIDEDGFLWHSISCVCERCILVDEGVDLTVTSLDRPVPMFKEKK
jgi:hypothetical protein